MARLRPRTSRRAFGSSRRHERAIIDCSSPAVPDPSPTTPPTDEELRSCHRCDRALRLRANAYETTMPCPLRRPLVYRECGGPPRRSRSMRLAARSSTPRSAARHVPTKTQRPAVLLSRAVALTMAANSSTDEPTADTSSPLRGPRWRVQVATRKGFRRTTSRSNSAPTRDFSVASGTRGA